MKTMRQVGRLQLWVMALCWPLGAGFVPAAAAPSPVPAAAAGAPAAVPSSSAAPGPAPGTPVPPNTSGPAQPDTDTPLPLIFQPSPIPLGHGLLVGGAVDLRTRTANTGRRGGVWVNAAELDFQHPITAKGVPHGNVVLQLIAEDPADIAHGNDVQVGEAYLLYKLPLRDDVGTTSFIKLGQFQIPFGLLAVYDPHLKIVQPLYAQSLGLRTDWGAALSGTLYGYLQYDFALTTGSGPNHADVDPDRLVTFRLGRSFSTRNGLLTVGGSLLSGRLPVTDPDASDPFAVELPPSGRSRPNRLDSQGERFTPKTRIGGDFTYVYKAITARGEAVAGANKSNRVLGYYIEGNYEFLPRVSGLLARSLFVYPLGNSNASREYVGLNYAAGRHLSLGAVYEYLRDVPRDASGRVRHRLTFQALLRF